MAKEKLAWFKFYPSDWMMGKIKKTPEITQARFINLCCLYWNKECNLSIEDAIIEIDKEHLDILISKKIVKTHNDFIIIEFLDSQCNSISENLEAKRDSGFIGNLKRWNTDIYNKYKSNEITISEAKTIIAHRSHTDRTPIAYRSQNIAEKRREEKRRVDRVINKINFSKKIDFISIFNIFNQRSFLELKEIIKVEEIVFDSYKKFLQDFKNYENSLDGIDFISINFFREKIYGKYSQSEIEKIISKMIGLGLSKKTNISARFLDCAQMVVPNATEVVKEQKTEKLPIVENNLSEEDMKKIKIYIWESKTDKERKKIVESNESDWFYKEGYRSKTSEELNVILKMANGV